MCINLGGGGGGDMLKPVVPPTPEATKHRTYLVICAAVQFALGIMMFFVDWYNGFYQIMLCLMLGCAIAQMNYCCVAFYMLYITMSWVTNVCRIGLVAQNHSIKFIYNNTGTSAAFQFTVSILITVYYTVAWFVCFYAYREFAAMLLDVYRDGTTGIPGMSGGQQQALNRYGGSTGARVN